MSSHAVRSAKPELEIEQDYVFSLKRLASKISELRTHAEFPAMDSVEGLEKPRNVDLDTVAAAWAFDERLANGRNMRAYREAQLDPHRRANNGMSHASHETELSIPVTLTHEINSQHSVPLGQSRQPWANATFVYEPEILGFLDGQFITAFPDNASARNLVSHEFAKRNRLNVNSSAKGKLQTAAGSKVNTLGTVTVPFQFSGELDIHMQEFHVLPRCLYDVILGSPFLRMTKTFTHFAHRIVKKLRSVSSKLRVCFTGSPQQMLAGWADGESTLALPDTGSDVCLMSLGYAKARGYRIDTDHKHRKRLEFIDGSTAEALGRVEAFQWEFDLSGSHVHYPDVYVLNGLQTDLLLSYDFLMESNAFSAHEQLFVDTEQHEESLDGWLVSAIKLVRESKLWNFGQKVAQKVGWGLPSYTSEGMICV